MGEGRDLYVVPPLAAARAKGGLNCRGATGSLTQGAASGHDVKISGESASGRSLGMGTAPRQADNSQAVG